MTDAMMLTLEAVIIIVVNVIILLIGYFRFKAKLELSIKVMDTKFTLDIQRNSERISSLDLELEKFKKESRTDIHGFIDKNEAQHNEIIQQLHKVDLGVTAIKTQVKAMSNG